MTRSDQIEALTLIELARKRPATQEECCAMAARITLACDPAARPATDLEFIDAAHGAARGLFGPAFEAADEGQRWAWIDMCERALRNAVAA